MVKTFEEFQNNSLDKKKFETFFIILSRYVQSDYKRFKWKNNYNYENYSGGNIGHGSIETYIFYPGHDMKVIINIDYITKREMMECVISFKHYGSREHYLDTVEKQNFPVTQVTPKGLGKLAQNISKWIEEQIKKVPG